MSDLVFSPRRRRVLIASAVAAVGPVAVSVKAIAVAPRGAGDRVEEPLLAAVYAGQVDPALCLVSEKYDGVRALWDGRVLRHRSGRPVAAPPGFLASLPAEPLDGELWLGRGRFEAVSALVRRAEPKDADWTAVRYMAFELPGGGGRFDERAARLAALARSAPGAPWTAAPQERVAGAAALQRRLEAITTAGGEGLMLHRADAPVATGRSDLLLKLKPHQDAEATVVAILPGRGKYRGDAGALEVESAEGRRFRVGSGLTDALRRDPPPVGSRITYRYRDLTSTGLPRFATYLRRAESI